MAAFLFGLVLFAQPIHSWKFAQLTDQDRAQIIEAFRSDWQERRDLAAQRSGAAEASELQRVEIIRCGNSIGFPACDLRVTVRQGNGQELSAEVGWRFRRLPDGTWMSAATAYRN